MIVTWLVLLLLAYCSDASGARFRSDYTYSNRAEGWLKLHEVPQTWRTAQLVCHDEGAVLASPLSFKLKDAILDFLEQESVDRIFTGVHDSLSKGMFASIEGVPFSRLAIEWSAGEPNNLDNSESCLAMDVSNNGTMSDVKCTAVFPFVCYRKRTKALLFSICGTHDIGYNLDQRTGSCYKFHRRGVTWKQASRTCMAEGGHLVIINSVLESTVVKDIYSNNTDNLSTSKQAQFASIGIFDYNDGGSWMTIHGETLGEAGYEGWSSGQPNNATQPEGEFCGVTNKTGYLFDAPCSWVIPFICEKQPESLEEEEEYK